MPAYLKIENIGVCPPEGFTVLGVSLADTSDNQGVIGQFGSGQQARSRRLPAQQPGPGRVLRDAPAGLLHQAPDRGRRQGEQGFRPCLRQVRRHRSGHGGQPVRHRRPGICLAYGEAGLERGRPGPAGVRFQCHRPSIREHGDWRSVKIEIVDETRVRAKRDHTRVFLPLTPEVLDFYNNLGKWFLHFSEPESLDKAILPKANRNLGDRKAAVIYRRGVRVREFESSDTEIPLRLQPERPDHRRGPQGIGLGCAASLRAGPGQRRQGRAGDPVRPPAELRPARLGIHLRHLRLAAELPGQHEDEHRKRRNWQEAFVQVAGETAVLTGEGTAKQLEGQGLQARQGPRRNC